MTKTTTTGRKANPRRKRENRVQFPTQRVKPATLARAHALSAAHGSLGRGRDAAREARHPAEPTALP